MKTCKRIFLVFFLFAFQSIQAQSDFEINKDFKSINFNKYINVYSTLDSINPNSLLDVKDSLWKENKVSYGFSNEYFWLKFRIRNVTSTRSDLYFEVNNPHIRFLEFYKKTNDSLTLLYKCGRHMPFDARPVDNVSFIFPIDLDNDEIGEYFIKVDKRTSSVSFPTKLWEKNVFIKMYNKLNLLNGIYFGGVLLAILYSIFAYANLRRKLYLYYGLYVAFIGLYMFTSAGYAFQYFVTDSIAFNSYFRVITLVLMIFFHAKFLQVLLKTKLYAKKLHVSLNISAYTLLGLTVFWLIYNQIDKTFVSLYLKTVYFLILILIIQFLLVCLYTYSKQKRIVKLYLLSFSAIIFVGVWLLLLEYGWFPVYKPTVSPLYWGSLIEIVILSVVLISEMRLVLKEKEKLSLNVAKKQQEVTQAYVNGIEKEKLRISEELHDDIGSQLATLNRFMANEGKVSVQTVNKIEKIIDDVRSISHKLSPNKHSLLSFKEQLQNVVEEALVNTSIESDLDFSEDYSYLDKNQQLNIYRIIQEFLHNTIKHANATTVEIQLTRIDDELILTIEDNGVGFDVNAKKSGLGIVNIQNRVDYLQGKLEISSIPKQGTYVLVTIPLT